MEYVIDRLKGMLKQEKSFAITPDNLEKLIDRDREAFEISKAKANERIPQLEKVIKLIEAETSKANLDIADVVDNLPVRKVCFFTLKDGKYLTENNVEINTDMLVKYNHQITDNWSYIIID
jgi:hypothetical protein